MACLVEAMERIVILHFPPDSIDYPPLTCAQLAAGLKQAGFQVSVIDLNLKLRLHARSTFQSSWLSIKHHYWHEKDRLNRFFQENRKLIDSLVQSVVNKQPTFLLAELTFPGDYFGCEFIRLVKKKLPDLQVIGHGLSCVLKEQQETLQQLSSTSFDAFLDGGSTTVLSSFLRSQKKARQTDISLLPTYDEFELDQYRGQILPVSLGFGCSGSCLFCKRHIYPDEQFLRPAKEIAKEIFSHIKSLGIRQFHLCDAPINSDPQIALELSNLLLLEKTAISWSAEATAQPPLSPPILVKMKEAGCHTLSICAVSGSEQILTQMNCGFSVTDIETLLDQASTAGISPVLTLISGFPKEYKKELLETFDFISRNKPPLIQAVKDLVDLRLYPSTRLYNDNGFEIQPDDCLSIDQWRCPDGNTFYRRKLFQNQLHHHILRYRIFYNPANLLNKTRGFQQHKVNGRYREIQYKLNSFYDPWHAYRSDILSKLIISYTCGRTTVVEKDEIDHPFIQGVDHGKEAFIGPETVHIDITNRCNFNCIACWDRSPLVREKGVKDDYLQKTLSYEQVTGFIDDLAELGGIRFIKFTGGGEPMMHPRFADILTYLRNKDKYVEIDINTNFSLMNDRLLDLIIEKQVNLLTVSLWAATPEVYVKTHPNQKEAAFEKIITNLKRITGNRNDKVLRVFIHNVLMSQNHHEVDDMLKLALEVGADEVHFTIVDPIPGKTDSLLLSHEEHLALTKSLQQIKPHVDRYNQYHEPGTDRTIQVTNFHEFYSKMSQSDVEEGVYDKRAADKIPCYIGWLYTRIMADGRVVPCCKGHRLPMGNLNNKRFLDIWNSPQYRKFRYNGLTLSKSAPYFSVMGDDGAGRTGCLNCDNIIHNTVMHDKVLCHSDMVKWFFFKLGQWWEKRP